MKYKVNDPLNPVPTGHPVVDSLLWLPGNALYDDRPKSAKQLWTFVCMMCGNRVTSEQNLQPMCTGPSWLDEHPPEVMESVSVGHSAKLVD